MESRHQDLSSDTIFAIATPPGVGGIGVIRVSGPDAPRIAQALIGLCPQPRRATVARFADEHGSTIDSGLALYFPAPHSFTGEHVVELQGHGGPVVQQMLSARIAGLGARPARPGEFSERAFLNDKLDLAQAEAIADLVASGTAAAARAAQRSLDGAFSRRVDALLDQLTALRVFVEAALDFPEEEIDFIAESDVDQRIASIVTGVDAVIAEAEQGRLLRDGVTVAIVGAPNAGKSSLLNALTGADAAIVTEVPGTTRDVLRETISIDGLPVHIADTAGIRQSDDLVEAEGIRRAQAVIATADIVIHVIDLFDPGEETLPRLPEGARLIKAWNKADIAQPTDQVRDGIVISARTGAGLDQLRQRIREDAGCASGGGNFSARARHLEALQQTRSRLLVAKELLEQGQSPEIVAEELRLAQQALGEITGAFLPDDLLGAIFASFCIGK
ncbi:MAG: tRNA uridine-5-carboxymethylaminomethyl(34) synthesis GTPase MnmE [Xanthomonadales bacterium]|nr:tRNA uridine-5-carboxymethylaminomethyl(34) synthesis GTPase MnmE [Xanthomonadales bacterium]